MSRSWPRITLVALVLLAMVGCGDDDSNPILPGGGGPSDTQFTGTYINGDEGGLMTLTTSTAVLAPGLHAGSVANDSVNALATLSPDDGSGVINLSGYYGGATDSIWLSGPGYTLVGAYDSTGTVPAISGAYVGPNGSGLFGCMIGNQNAIKVYCGTYASSSTATAGRWNFGLMGGRMMGIAYPTGLDPNPLHFDGTVSGSGTTRSLSLAGSDAGIVLTGSGTLNTSTNTVSGDWATSGNGTDSGTWSGELCLPGTTGRSVNVGKRPR